MLRLAVLLASLIFLPASPLVCQAAIGSQKSLQAWPAAPSGATTELIPASLVLELDRAIHVLKQGLEENWRTRGQYLSAFEKTPNTDSTGRPVTEEKKYVECSIRAHLRIHENGDEGLPIGVEAHRAIAEFTKWRSEAEQATITRTGFSNPERQPAEFQLPPCAAPRKVAISAAVAASMLKTKSDPAYPPQVGGFPISGVVVLHATINAKGAVKALTVISGPASLQQPALDAVRHWTYRPYVLNNTPVEVETTINVIFRPNR
jgi:TonB family protein